MYVLLARYCRAFLFLKNYLFWKMTGVNVTGFVKIGRFVRINKPINIRLGEKTTLHQFVYLKSVPGKISIGKNTSIGEYTYINSMESVSIGDNVLIAPFVHVTDANHLFNDLDECINMQGRISSPVVIENNVWVGSGVRILSGVTVASGSVVGAGSIVTKTFPPNSIIVGNPAKLIRRR